MWRAGSDGWLWTYVLPLSATVQVVPLGSGIHSWCSPIGKKWRILIHGNGGGFGVGSDVDVAATGRAEWQFARHFGITMAYGGIHFSESNTVASGTLTISPTLHGPIFGFGLFF